MNKSDYLDNKESKMNELPMDVPLTNMYSTNDINAKKAAEFDNMRQGIAQQQLAKEAFGQGSLQERARLQEALRNQMARPVAEEGLFSRSAPQSRGLSYEEQMQQLSPEEQLMNRQYDSMDNQTNPRGMR